MSSYLAFWKIAFADDYAPKFDNDWYQELYNEELEERRWEAISDFKRVRAAKVIQRAWRIYKECKGVDAAHAMLEHDKLEQDFREALDVCALNQVAFSYDNIKGRVSVYDGNTKIASIPGTLRSFAKGMTHVKDAKVEHEPVIFSHLAAVLSS